MATLRPTLSTPAGYLAGFLGQLKALNLDGEPSRIAGVLREISPLLEEAGRADLAGRLNSLVPMLEDGSLIRTGWSGSSACQELDEIRQALEQGNPLDQAVALKRLVGPLDLRPKSVTSRRHPQKITIGPPPRIAWEKFGSVAHPAPRPPGPGIATASQRLSYFFLYVAGREGHGETDTATADFYGIGSESLRRLRDGLFGTKALGQFSSGQAEKIIATAVKIDPLYGQLMKELLIQLIFESQDWSLGVPTKDAGWDLFLLTLLRRFVAGQLLTEEGRKMMMAEKSLIRVVRRQVRLNDVTWHAASRETRREVLEQWFDMMERRHPTLLRTVSLNNFQELRTELGDRLLREHHWEKPPDGTSLGKQLQWEVRHWIDHTHYGALPARGLPYPTGVILRFAMAKSPDRIHPDFENGIRRMIGEKR